jgi:hypothetical protein
VLNRWCATKITREWNVPNGGVGYVTRFQVRRHYLERFAVQQVGGRDVLDYWIPAEDLAEFNANIMGAIVEEAPYRGPVTDQEFADVAHEIGRPFPVPWRDYLQRPSWFGRGWLPGGDYLAPMAPKESLAFAKAWPEGRARLPGLAILSGDGSREVLAVDLRDDQAHVVLIDVTSTGWANAAPQASSVQQFIERIEADTFEFAWHVTGRGPSNRG